MFARQEIKNSIPMFSMKEGIPMFSMKEDF
jgi:hypothetical protein